MASPAVNTPPGAIDVDTDYGSDFSVEEEELINHLLIRHDPTSGILRDIEDNPIINDIEYHDSSQTLRIPRILARERWISSGEAITEESIGAVVQLSVLPVDPGYPDLSRALPVSPSREVYAEADLQNEADVADTRSPLERFRTRPKKALSVTDLVSPAWCELQYYYTMKFHGRKKRTAAMKRGSAVHQQLEDQIYTTVKVDIETKEDAWGLRIWNVIQGLHTLQETGHTRELEIWGIVHGQVVNGVIDELSYVCPDAKLESQLCKKSAPKKDELPADQTSLSDFFKVSGGTSISGATRSRPADSQSDRIYLCDVKTRGARSLPTDAAMRSTKYQLMLYHHLLGALATNKVDFSILTTRYDLNGSAPFSDSFVAQIGSLNDEVFFTPPESTESSPVCTSPPSSQDSVTMLLSHNSLNALWSLMISTFQTLLPNGVESLGPILKAEYRSSSDGSIMGAKTFPMDEAVLDRYIALEMQWWKGERDPVGVVVEEAFKCRSCDFADSCEWRLERVQDAVAQARNNKGRPAKSYGRKKLEEDLDEEGLV